MDDRKKNKERLILELEALREQNRQLLHLIENSKEMLYRMALPEGEYEYVNPASSDVFGYSPKEFYQTPLLIRKIIHPDWREYFEKQWLLLVAGDMPPFYEYRIIDKSGDARWIYQKNVLVRDPGGKPIAIEGIVTDITERKNIEAALRVSESRLLEAQQMANIGHWYWDVKTGDVEWSEEVFNIFGLDPKEFKPQIDSILSLSPWPEDHQRDQELIQKAIESRKKGSYEQRFLYPDGSTGYYFSTFQGIYDDDNLLAIKGTVQNITERKRAEESLRNSEARFRDLVEMLPEAVFEIALNLDLIFANQRAFELFGYTQEDLDRGINGIEIIAPEDRDFVRQNLARRLKGVDDGTIEYQALKKDGTVFPILLHASPILKQDDIIGFRGIIIDITERKQAEMERTQLEEQYRQAQKVESIGRLAGGVAHDLNNLLAPILGYGEMLMDDFAPNDVRREPVAEILHSALRAKDLVGQLLAFSRKQTLEYKTLDMNRIIKGVENLLRHTIRENIIIDIILSKTTQTIQADIGQIEQVILNLAVNAQDAMPEGGILTIETAIVKHDEKYVKEHYGAKAGDFVMLAVSDSGCGMDEATREQIFEPFFSTKGELGTGLGLATVYGIVKQHEGNIFVYSELGTGTTFKIYLPYCEKQPVEKAARKKKITELRGSETILLAEDNKHVRRLSMIILQRHGYTVIEAENGSEALAALDSHDGPVHLLLTDVVMPEMNGSDLFAKAAQMRPGLKVIFMSGYTDNVIAHHGILEEGIQFIQKPFTLEALAVKIREVLDE